MRSDDDDGWYMEHVLLAQAARETSQQTAWRVLADRLRKSDEFGRLATQQGFVLTRPQVLGLGLSAAQLRRKFRSGQSARRGVISPFAIDDGSQDAIAASAAALVRRGTVVSRRSAAHCHDLPSMPVGTARPRSIELTAADAKYFRATANLLVSTAHLSPSEITSWQGAPVTTIERTVVDLARHDRREGLIAADAALFRGWTTPRALRTAVERISGQTGVAITRDIIEFASPMRESPLESVTGLFIRDQGLPAPELQVWIRDPSDGWRARVDGLWRARRVVLEADGRSKYTNDELWKEKLRQERLEQLGYRVVRVRWAEVMVDTGTTGDRLRSALRLV